MKIGYLHIGPPQHGVCRYGRMLAAEAKQRSHLTVIEANVVLTEDTRKNQELLVQAAQLLSAADIVHFQFTKFNRALWGNGWVQVHNLRTFMRHCASPMVVTLHDVFYPPYGIRGILKRVYSKLRPVTLSAVQVEQKVIESRLNETSMKQSKLTGVSKAIQNMIVGTFGPEAAALRQVVGQAVSVFVCTEEEARRLHNRLDRSKLKVIPHFVEERTISSDPATVRRALGLEDFKIVTLLGFIYPPKGHRILVEALPYLSQDVMVIFAGGASSTDNEKLVTELTELAKAKGVSDRLRITGYLSEEELERYLIVTDLGVCPFSRFSASGSLSTWISVVCPVLASNLPQVAEYNSLEIDAIKLFQPYTPTALADAIQNYLKAHQDKQKTAIERLRQKLSIAAIFDKHLSYYQHSFKKVGLS